MSLLIDRAERRVTYPQPWVQPRVRLFCFPYSGAGASIYYNWQEGLPKQIDLFPVQLPGRENRIKERPYTAITPLVERVAEEIRPYLDMPFALFGHSMGALLSFELARYLRREMGVIPEHLFASGHAAPQIIHYDRPIHSLPDNQFTSKIKEMNGTPEDVLSHPELRTLFLPLLRADFTLCEVYEYRDEAALECPITAMGGLADPFVSRPDLEAWQRQTRGFFTLRMFPGDHFYLHEQRPLLLRVLAQGLL
ncbi:MAG TPA: thioesterase [Anaerolineae bacterium]|nr:thioesterase [Anaerolineae bacterium]